MFCSFALAAEFTSAAKPTASSTPLPSSWASVPRHPHHSPQWRVEGHRSSVLLLSVYGLRTALNVFATRPEACHGTVLVDLVDSKQIQAAECLSFSIWRTHRFTAGKGVNRVVRIIV